MDMSHSFANTTETLPALEATADRLVDALLSGTQQEAQAALDKKIADFLAAERSYQKTGSMLDMAAFAA